MRKNITRAIAALTVVALGTLALEFGGTPPIAAADGTVNIQCDGITGDVAGSLSGAPKSSKELVGLLGAITGTPGLPPLPVNVTSNVPAKIKKGSGDVPVSFTYNIGFPDAMVKALRDQLGKSSLEVVDATIGVSYDGAVSGSMETKIASQTIDFNGGGTTSITVTGKIPSDTSGRVTFRPGAFSLGAKIDATAAGIAQIGTLSLACGSSQSIGYTNIQIPGSPNVPGIIDAQPIAGGQIGLTQIVGRPDITADDGNPILWDTLKVTNSQGGFLKNGYLVQLSTDDGGFFTNDLEVCAPSRPVPEVPGKDEVQTFTWGDKYFGKPLNAHPLSVTFMFKGAESKPVSLSSDVLGNTTLGNFVAPSAAAMQKALEATPTIGAGNIKVDKRADGTYAFTFQGALGLNDQPDITIGRWNTWAPYEQYAKIQAAITALSAPKPPPDPNAPPDPKATDLTLAELQAQLVAGTITFQQFSDKFGSALANSVLKDPNVVNSGLDFVNNVFPAIPTMATATVGEPTIPATETGPLCSQFQVKTTAVSKVFLFYLWLLQHPEVRVQACTVRRVPYRVRVYSRSRHRYVKVVRYRTVKKNCGKRR
jgi:hypothetical protein